MAQIRTANAHWEGDLFGGSGTIAGATSGSFGPLQVTWKARAEASDTGLTSPEELLAAAWASCYAMASSNALSKAGFPPASNDVRVDLTFDKTDAGFTVTSAVLHLRASAPGIEESAFREAVEGAKDGCPISRALKGNVEVTLDAELV
ncbi:MAG: OsmC family peroxiredoxin [Chloroflexi bacterium]|nr:OsmC family peroxiredoxin [Chloroflexota bacterium]